MKKISLLAIATLAIISVQAQSVGLGVKGGLNFPSADALSIDQDITIESATSAASGFHAGIFASAKVAMFEIQPEVLYSFQSFDYEFEDATAAAGALIQGSQESHYVTIPVILKFSPVPILNLQVGPQFGLLLSANEIRDDIGSATSADITEKLTNSDIGLNFGIGADLPFGIQAHARYVLGLSNVNVDSPADVSVSNSMIQVSIGYAFLGK
jgi:hypothetical protein